MLKSQYDHFIEHFLENSFEMVIESMDKQQLFRDFDDALMDEVIPVVVWAYRAGWDASQSYEGCQDAIKRCGLRGVTVKKLKKAFRQSMKLILKHPAYSDRMKAKIKQHKEAKARERRLQLQTFREAQHGETVNKSATAGNDRFNRFG